MYSENLTWCLRGMAAACAILVLALHCSHATERLYDTADETVDTGDTPTAWRLSDEAAYALYPGAYPRSKHYVRAGLEILALLGVGMASYWADHATNSEDWDLRWDLESWKDKLVTGEGIAFDTNYFTTNSLRHAVAGSLYYLSARTNTLSIPVSLLYAIAGSTLWEYVGEFQEKVSINDLILTPFAGMAVGEVLAQLGGFFDRGAPSPVNTIFSTLFAPPRRLHHWLDGTTPQRTGHVDAFGFTRDMAHQFRLWTASGVETTSQASHPRGLVQIGLETHFINIPGYHQAAQISRLLTDGNISTLHIETTFGHDGLRDVWFFTKAALGGYFTQHIEPRAGGHDRGSSTFIGVATAFDYTFDRLSGREDDTLAVVHLLGPTFAWSTWHCALQVDTGLDVYGDFALVRSYAVDQYLANGGTLEGAKSVLVARSYYYAFGVTVAPRVRVAYNGWELGGTLTYDYLRSIEGADRYPERVTNDFSLTDQRLRVQAWAAYTVPNNRFQFALTVEYRYRQGEMLEVSDATQLYRYMGRVTLLF
jgi:hypothetical protein